MDISSNLRNKLRNWASNSEIDDFEGGDLDLQIVLGPNDINIYHLQNNTYYKASMELHVDHSTGDMEFAFPVSSSSERDIISDLNNADTAEITVEIGDWDNLLP